MGTKAKRARETGAKGSVSAALIAQAKQHAQKAQKLSAHGVEHLRELCEYNDSAAHGQRVARAAVVASLRDHFGWQGARAALDVVCKTQLGRESFARKGAQS